MENQMRWLNDQELKQFKSVGKNVLVDATVQFICPENIVIGNHVRIDCFSMLSALNGIEFGDYIHLAPYAQLVAAGGKIIMHNYTALAARTTVLTASDDFTEGYMNNPMMPMEVRKVKMGPITFEKFAMTGCGSVVLPGVTMHEGSAAGALTLVSKNVKSFDIVVGSPNKIIGTRNKDNLHLMEKKLHEIMSTLSNGA
jgi:galactoside O-acetyltransferase